MEKTREAVHFCDTEEGWRPCPANLCEAERLLEKVAALEAALRDVRQRIHGRPGRAIPGAVEVIDAALGGLREAP